MSTTIDDLAVRSRLGRRVLRLLLIAGASLAVLLLALWAVLRVALLPQTGEWATTLGRGPLAVRASLPQLVWLATTPWVGERLDGLTLPSRLGPLRLGWVPAGVEGDAPVLTVHCEPCTLPLPPALGQPTLRVPAAQLAISRDGVQHLKGALLLGAEGPDEGLRQAQPERETDRSRRTVISARWQARRAGPGWQATVDWPATPARDWLALLAPGLPELAAAHVEGSVALHADVTLPPPAQGQGWRLVPRIEGLAVSGLGTESWARAQTSCGRTPPLPARHWLTRAVLATEDQRFYEHTGYDPEELAAALQANRQAGAIRRGGSTLSQQLAKLMVAGGERQLERKLRELLYALDAEQSLGKGRILQLYLANAPWGVDAQGRLVCGAEAAARHYFGTGARRLTPRQAVTLAAMLHNPPLEAARWQARGSVDPARLRWVAGQVRGVPARQRRALVAQLEEEATQQEADTALARAEPAQAAASASEPERAPPALLASQDARLR